MTLRLSYQHLNSIAGELSRPAMRVALVATIVLGVTTTIVCGSAEAATPRGFLDGVKHGQMFGWAVDPAKPAGSVAVAVYLDGPKGVGRLIDSFATNVMRADVNKGAATTGAHGYSWSIPEAYRRTPHLWYVYADDANGDSSLLANSPKLFPAVTAAAEGPPQVVYDYATQKCDKNDISDQPARAWRDKGGAVSLVASHINVRRAVGATLNSVAHQCAVLHPSDRDSEFGDFRYNEWLMAPYTLDGVTIYGLMHNEWYGSNVDPACRNHDIDSWVSAIILSVSHDGGGSFEIPTDYLVRHPVTAWSNSFSCTKQAPTLYGDFGGSNIVAKDKYYYKLFIYWPEPSVGTRKPTQCMMRTQHLDDAESWEIWTGGGYTPSKTAPCAPVASLSNAQSVTFNTYLKMYLATEYSPATGFFFVFLTTF